MVTKDFDELKAHAEEHGLRPCGAFLADGTPVYFAVPADATDADVRAKAFEIRNGRPMTSYERWALEVAERQHGNLQDEAVPA